MSELILEFLELVLPPAWIALFHAHPEFLDFLVGVLAVGLIYLLLVRRVWRPGGNGSGEGGDDDGSE